MTSLKARREARACGCRTRSDAKRAIGVASRFSPWKPLLASTHMKCSDTFLEVKRSRFESYEAARERFLWPFRGVACASRIRRIEARPPAADGHHQRDAR